MITNLNLSQMTEEVGKWCERKGWRDKPVTWGASMDLLHSEVSEMLEAYRLYAMNDATSTDSSDNPVPGAKPEGVASEIADLLIRLLDDCERYNVDLADQLGLCSPTMAIHEGDPFEDDLDGLHNMISLISMSGTPETNGTEGFADLYVVLHQFCMKHDIDLESEYKRKMAYNETREYRHGGKLL